MSLKIGILGSRGFPNRYGGYEQFVEKFAPLAVTLGHKVTVYCPNHHPEKAPEIDGVERILCFDPEPSIGTAGQFVYDFNCIVDSRTRNFDIILQLGYTSSCIWFWLHPKTAKVVLNTDGIEWKRSKYSAKVQAFLKWGEKLAIKQSDGLVADNLGIQFHLEQLTSLPIKCIEYGAEIISSFNASLLQKFGVKPFEYYALMARFEPENNIEMILEGYTQSNATYPMIVVGNFNNHFGQKMKATYNQSSIIYTGWISDFETLSTLRHYATAYLHGHSVGGTNPSLLDAMGGGAEIWAHNNEFNSTVLGEHANYFTSAKELKQLFEQPQNPTKRKQNIEANIIKIKEKYNWKLISEAYLNFFDDLMQQ